MPCVSPQEVLIPGPGWLRNGALSHKAIAYYIRHLRLQAWERHEQLKQEMKTSKDQLNEMIIKFNESNENTNSFLPNGSSLVSNTTDINELDILKQLEYQFKALLEQSFDYEEQLDSKVILISELENKLAELSHEIEELQDNIHREESISKKDDSNLTT